MDWLRLWLPNTRGLCASGICPTTPLTRILTILQVMWLFASGTLQLASVLRTPGLNSLASLTWYNACL